MEKVGTVLVTGLVPSLLAQTGGRIHLPSTGLKVGLIEGSLSVCPAVIQLADCDSWVEYPESSDSLSVCPAVREIADADCAS